MNRGPSLKYNGVYIEFMNPPQIKRRFDTLLRIVFVSQMVVRVRRTMVPETDGKV